MTAREQKAAWRAEMRARRRGVAPAERARVSRLVCARLLARPLGSAVAVYLAGPDEIDLTPFIETALARGIRLLAPRWTGETYELAELRGLAPAGLRVGPHGVREPREASPAAARPTAWLVPGLAFTRDGRRLGYGGGWYDRLLASAEPTAQRLGIAYSFQVVDVLPSEPHDVRLTDVVCATGCAVFATEARFCFAKEARLGCQASPENGTIPRRPPQREESGDTKHEKKTSKGLAQCRRSKEHP